MHVQCALHLKIWPTRPHWKIKTKITWSHSAWAKCQFLPRLSIIHSPQLNVEWRAQQVTKQCVNYLWQVTTCCQSSQDYSLLCHGLEFVSSPLAAECKIPHTHTHTLNQSVSDSQSGLMLVWSVILFTLRWCHGPCPLSGHPLYRRGQPRCVSAEELEWTIAFQDAAIGSSDYAEMRWMK